MALSYKKNALTKAIENKQSSSKMSSKGPVQGPVMKNGAFYSKQSPNSAANRQVATQRKDVEKKSKSKGSKKSSLRDMAKQAFDATLGVPTAEAKTESPRVVKPSTVSRPSVKTGIGRAVDVIKDPLGLKPRIMGMRGGGADMGISEALGINKLLEKEGGLLYNMGDTPSIYEDNDGSRQTVMPSDPNSVFYAPKPIPQKQNRIGQDSPTGSTPTPVAQNNLNQVSNPFTSQPASNPFTDLAQQEGDTQMSMAEPMADNTQIVNNPGTRRGLLGMGYLSNGVASNGKGNYGFDGASLGSGGDIQDEQTLLEKLGLISTAQAAELPAMPSARPTMGGTNSFSPMGATSFQAPSMTNQGRQSYNPGAFQMDGSLGKLLGGQGTGGYSAPVQASGGATGGYQDPEQQYYDESIGSYGAQIKQQEKMNKQMQRDLAKAWKAQQEQINGQYAQSQTEGTQSLEGLKREDLLKLSGLFNFANQDPNSEQRMQYEQRTNNDYAGQLTALINKLSQAKQQDLLGAESSYNTNLGNVRQQGQSALQSLMEAQNNARMNVAKLKADQMAQRAKGSGGSSALSLKQLGVDENGAPIWLDQKTGQIMDYNVAKATYNPLNDLYGQFN